jgi:hypothetical protein
VQVDANEQTHLKWLTTAWRSNSRLFFLAQLKAQKPPLAEPAFIGSEHTAEEVLAMRTNSRLAPITLEYIDLPAALRTVYDMRPLFRNISSDRPAGGADPDSPLGVAWHRSLEAAGKACVDI